MQFTVRRKTPETGAAPCASLAMWLVQPPWCGAISSEEIQGDEWGA
jgi:hypothetical protein